MTALVTNHIMPGKSALHKLGLSLRLHAATPLKVRELVYQHLTDEHGVASFVVLARRLDEGKCQAIF